MRRPGASADLLPISIEDQIVCIERELALRHRAYPGFIAKGRMKQAKADREIAVMKEVLATLQLVKIWRDGSKV